MTDTPKAKPQPAPSPDIWSLALKESGVAFGVASLLLIIFYVFAFRWIHPEFAPFMDREATKLIAPGKDLIPISVGSFRVEGSIAIVEDFNGDEAILALPRAFQAEDYPFIKVNLTGFTRYSKFKILWRQAENPSQTHALEFNRSGDEATQIAMVYGHDNYRGRIADIALLFYDGPALGFQNNNGIDVVVRSIELRPFSAWRVAEQIFEDWTNPPLLLASSHNIVPGIHFKGLVFPNAVTNLLLLVGLVLLCARRMLGGGSLHYNSYPPAIMLALALVLYGWGSNEILQWHWRVEHVIDAKSRYWGKTLEQRVINDPLRCERFPTDCDAGLLPHF